MWLSLPASDAGKYSLYSGTSCAQLKSWGLHYYARKKEWTVWMAHNVCQITLSKCKSALITLLKIAEGLPIHSDWMPKPRRCPAGPYMSCVSSLWPHFLPLSALLTLLEPRWPPCWFSNKPSTFLPLSPWRSPPRGLCSSRSQLLRCLLRYHSIREHLTDHSAHLPWLSSPLTSLNSYFLLLSPTDPVWYSLYLSTFAYCLPFSPIEAGTSSVWVNAFCLQDRE